MAIAAAPSPSYSSLSEPSACEEDWSRMEKKGFPESTAGQPEYLSSETNLMPHVGQRTSSLLTDESAYTCTPWKTKQYSCDPSGLHEEVNDFYEYMKPRPSEIRMRSDVIMRVMNTVLYRYPSAQIDVFGSFTTGLFLPTSDLDLVVFCSPQPSLFALEEDFRAYDIPVEGSTMVLDKTTVPVIKYTDKATEVKVDISFNRVTGIKSKHLIQQFIQAYPFLPRLVLVLKQFLFQQGLHEVFNGGISSYCVILLLVSFLQRHPRYGGTDFSSASLGELLIEFFELYGKKFNYMKTGISVEDGGSYISKDDVPTQDFLYIIDPVEPAENAAKGCFGMWQVKQAFELAYKRLSSAVLSRENPIPKRESILGAIVQVPCNTHEYRNWVDSHWLNHPISPPTTHPTIYYPTPMVHIPPVQPLPPFQYYHQIQPYAVSSEIVSIQQNDVATSSSYNSEHPSSNSSAAHGDTTES